MYSLRKGDWTAKRFYLAMDLKKPNAVSILVFVCLLTNGLGQSTLPPGVADKVASGVAALKSGDLETANRVLTQTLQSGVKHPLIFHNLGVIAQQRGNHQEAVTRFREAIALQRDYGPSHLLLGSSLLALGRNTEAIQELKRAAVLMPAEPQTHMELAKAYEVSGKWTLAVQEWEKLVELAPQEAEYSYQLGKAWLKLSEWSYGEIVRVNPNSARLQQALGQDYAIQEKYDLALAAYKRAAAADPKLPEIHLGIALICLQLKKFDEALAEINQELTLVPESTRAAQVKQQIEAAMALPSR